MMIKPPKRWSDRTDLQLRWQQTWLEPHMVAGLDALKEMGYPTPTLTVDAMSHALMNSFREGYFETLANIDRMKPQIEVARTPEPAPFAHIRARAEAAFPESTAPTKIS
jgi:hypothetical protein